MSSLQFKRSNYSILHPLDVAAIEMLVLVNDKIFDNLPQKTEFCLSYYPVEKIIKHDMPFEQDVMTLLPKPNKKTRVFKKYKPYNDIGLIKVKWPFNGVSSMARLPQKSATVTCKNQILKIIVLKVSLHDLWFSDYTRCLVLGWGRTTGQNVIQKLTKKLQNSHRLQKVETFLWLPPDYFVIPWEEAKPFNLTKNKMIRTEPSILKVKNILLLRDFDRPRSSFKSNKFGVKVDQTFKIIDFEVTFF